MSPRVRSFWSSILTILTLCAVLASGDPAHTAAADSYPEPTPRPFLHAGNLTGAEVESLLVQAERHLSRQQPDLAQRLYARIPDGSPRKARALLGEGTCLFAAGHYERALRVLRTVRARVDRDGGNLEIAAACLELTGQSYLYLGRTGPARETYRELEAMDPARRDHCRVMMARAYEADGAYRDALDTVAPVLDEGRFAPAYDFSLDLFWKLDGKDRQRMNRLLERFLANTQKESTGRG
jgi:tetratricopeptide (TPR) repeat protein